MTAGNTVRGIDPSGSEPVLAGMWDAIKAAIESNATTVRFIAIIIVLAAAAWFTRTLF